jgi:hypothetical protein
MKSFIKILNIPIYKATVRLVVCDLIRRELETQESVRLFGERGKADYDGLCIGTGYGLFGVYLCRSKLSAKLINHEVYHLTCQIFKYHNCQLNEYNEENAALLNEYLNSTIWDCVWKFTTS